VITAPQPTGNCAVCTHRDAVHRAMGREEDAVTFGNGWCSDCSDCGARPADSQDGGLTSPLILRARESS
jgi:hypothetical protein